MHSGTTKCDGMWTISVEPPKLTPDDVKKLEEANRAAQDAK